MYKNDIGINADEIFCLLADNGVVTIREIGELIHYSETFIFLALGWLAREDKIEFFEKDGRTLVALKGEFPEMYVG
jgi:hypothetical protein